MATCRLHLAVLGHVDHGKSTVVGQLLFETGTVGPERLAQVRARCERHGKQFEYAFLLDALADEQAQGITIEAARAFFRTSRREYLVLDAPGHIDFLRNMVTGAAHAQAALLVVDAELGIEENTQRHARLANLLGVARLILVINKLDRVGWSESRFAELERECRRFLERPPVAVVPVAALSGDNIARPSPHLPWYTGPSLLQALDALEPAAGSGDFRMFVQDVYKFTRYGDQRRIVAGSVGSGSVRVGDELVFYPSARRSRVIEILGASGECHSSPGLVLEPQIYLARGELAVCSGQTRPLVSSRFRASVFWLGPGELHARDLKLRLGTATTLARLEPQGPVDSGVVECLVTCRQALAFDPVAAFHESARFVLFDNHRISGGGIIREGLPDPLASTWEQTFRRNRRWISGPISPPERSERYGGRSHLVVITGPAQVDRKALGQALEARLFAAGRAVYFCGIGNLVHGLAVDVEDRHSPEHIRRLGEVANLMLQAGLVFVVSAANLSQEELGRIQIAVGRDNLTTVWMGPGAPVTDVQVMGLDEEPILQALQERGLI